MIAFFKALFAPVQLWLASKLRLIEYATLAVILALTFYGGYHTRVILDEAAQSKQTAKLVEAAPKIITQTQILYKVLHDAKDPCSTAPVPPAMLDRLR